MSFSQQGASMSKDQKIAKRGLCSTMTVAITALFAVAASLSWMLLHSHRTSIPVPKQAGSQERSDANLLSVPWDREHREDFIQLKSRGDVLAIHGDWQAAYDAYQQCVVLVADHELSDPVALNMVACAQENQSRLLECLSRAHTAQFHQTDSTVSMLRVTDASASARLVSAVPAGSIPTSQTDACPGTSKTEAGGIDQTKEVKTNSPSPVTPGKLFTSSADRSSGRPESRVSPTNEPDTSSLGTGSNLPDFFQPPSGFDPLRPAVVTPISRPAPPGQKMSPSEISLGSGSQHVWVILGQNSIGKGRVAGTVDGHPFTIGGPGEPTAILFTGLPAGTIPVEVGGQPMSYNGVTIPFTLPSNAFTSPPSRSGGASASATATSSGSAAVPQTPAPLRLPHAPRHRPVERPNPL